MKIQKTVQIPLFSSLASELKFALLLTSLTFLGLIVGLIGENVPKNMSQGHLIMWGGFGLSYVAGGIPAGYEALKSLFSKRRLDVDLLMVLAALGAASIGQVADGAILLFLFSLSNTLQDWAMGRTKNAISALMELNPEGAIIRRDQIEKWCELDQIKIGDTLIIKPGERIVADSRISQGYTSVDESPITGESHPIDKDFNDFLASGTINLNGSVEAMVIRSAGESTLARLVKLMENAQTQKSRTEYITEKYESPYAILVLIAVPLIFAGLYFWGGLEIKEAWYRTMTFMVVASPCAVVISTPAVMLSAMATAARAGVLFKSSASVDTLAGIRTIAFDKTGTLTQAKMTLKNIVSEDEEYILALAAGLEMHSEHPIAKAIVQAAQEANIRPIELHEAQAIPGYGIEAYFESKTQSDVETVGEKAWAGNLRLARRQGACLSDEYQNILDQFNKQGSSSVVIGVGKKIVGIMFVEDALRVGIADVMSDLKKEGIEHTVMLTGDKKEVAKKVAEQVGLNAYHAELLPEDKLQLIGELSKPIAMIGDGVNDGPALVRADLGVAVASGTDVAIDSADVVLAKNDLGKLVGALRLAKEARKTVLLNLFFAFAVIIIVAPLAVAGKIPLPLGVIAHEGGTVFVVFMGLRLLAYRM